MADKLVIFDDDVCFGALLTAKARSQGFDTHFFTSLVDMGSFARIKDFDLAIIDFYLGTIRGDEIAEYVDTFFDQIPVIIVSSQEMTDSRISKWPVSVRMFIPKADGATKIIDAAKSILRRERLLKRLQTSPPTADTQPPPSSGRTAAVRASREVPGARLRRAGDD